jgi:hypothetical protein
MNRGLCVIDPLQQLARSDSMTAARCFPNPLDTCFVLWLLALGDRRNMQLKLLVALQLEVPLRFIHRLASGRARRVEDPGAFGATPTPKTVMFDPYELT